MAGAKQITKIRTAIPDVDRAITHIVDVMNPVLRDLQQKTAGGQTSVCGELVSGPTTTTNANDTYTTVAGNIKTNTEAVYVGSSGNLTRVARAKYQLQAAGGKTKVVFALGYIPDFANGEIVMVDYVTA